MSQTPVSVDSVVCLYLMPTREEKLLTIPSSMRATYRKSTTSRSAAIKAFCQECAGYDRATIRECKAEACPLLAFRPYQTGDADDAPDEVVADGVGR
jgi:hypothetical protein